MTHQEEPSQPLGDPGRHCQQAEALENCAHLDNLSELLNLKAIGVIIG